MPVFAIFLPAPAAIAATAVVHLLNNATKFALLKREVTWRVVIRFGLPALALAPIGALALDGLSGLQPIASFQLVGVQSSIHPVNFVVGVLLMLFGVQEAVPRLVVRFQVPERYLPIGGVLSGFIGGLSGLQGALRSAFLIRADLGRDAFIATGGAVAMLVDVGRLTVYGLNGTLAKATAGIGIVGAGIAGGLAGTLLGNQLLPKVTLRAVQLVVGTMLIVLAVALALGLL